MLRLNLQRLDLSLKNWHLALNKVVAKYFSLPTLGCLLLILVLESLPLLRSPSPLRDEEVASYYIHQLFLRLLTWKLEHTFVEIDLPTCGDEGDRRHSRFERGVVPEEFPCSKGMFVWVVDKTLQVVVLRVLSQALVALGRGLSISACCTRPLSLLCQHLGR